MQSDFEDLILRNPALGASLIWWFCATFVDASKTRRGATLPEIAIAMPMLVHRPTVEAIKNLRLREGSLARAIAREPDIAAGLQERMEGAISFVMQSLGLATASNLVVATADVGSFDRYVPARPALPTGLEHACNQIRDARDAAKRLGTWIAADGLAIASAQLRVRF